MSKTATKNTRRKKFRLLICPSQEGERSEKLEEASNYREVKKLIGDEDVPSLQEVVFDTIKERNAFIDGYETAVGWLGEGWWMQPEENEK